MQGYTTVAGAVAQFPVVIGEFGSGLADASEQAFLRDLALFANNLGGGAQPPHANITSWAWCGCLSVSGGVAPQNSHAPPDIVHGLQRPAVNLAQ